MEIKPTLDRKSVAGDDVGRQLVAWEGIGVIGAVLAVLGLLVGLAQFAETVGWGMVALLVVLLSLPVLLLVGCWVARKMMQRLAYADGELSYTGWRRTRVTLGPPEHLTVERGMVRFESALDLDVPVLVLDSPVADRPVLVRARHWPSSDLAQLWRRMQVRPQGRFDREFTATELRRDHPGMRLPWSLSRPGLIWLVAVLGTLGYIAAIIALFVALAESAGM